MIIMAMPGIPIDGQKLEAARTAKRLSPRTVATSAGCSSGHIRLIERGIRYPSLELLGRLEAILEVTAEQLGAHIPSNSPH